MPGPETKPLFDEARRLGVGFSLGFAELAEPTSGGHHYNTTVLVDADGREVARYRKIHLPGHEQHEPWRPFQHLERAYFDPGPDGFARPRRLRRARSGWPRATTAAGPRPTACSACRASSWS